jgi:hypothetical protein
MAKLPSQLTRENFICRSGIDTTTKFAMGNYDTFSYIHERNRGAVLKIRCNGNMKGCHSIKGVK